MMRETSESFTTEHTCALRFCVFAFAPFASLRETPLPALTSPIHYLPITILHTPSSVYRPLSVLRFRLK